MLVHIVLPIQPEQNPVTEPFTKKKKIHDRNHLLYITKAMASDNDEIKDEDRRQKTEDRRQKTERMKKG